MNTEKLFHRDSLEVFPIIEKQEILMDKIKAYSGAVGGITQRYELEY